MTRCVMSVRSKVIQVHFFHEVSKNSVTPLEHANVISIKIAIVATSVGKFGLYLVQHWERMQNMYQEIERRMCIVNINERVRQSEMV